MRHTFRFTLLFTSIATLVLATDAATIAEAGTLFGVNTVGNDSLLTIDPATGAATVVGPIGFQNVTSLAYDASSNTLFGVPFLEDDLIAIDPTTGAGTLVGGLGIDEIRISGLAFSFQTGVLFGTTGVNGMDDLVTIDTATGQATLVGSTGLISIEGLAYDPATDRLLGANGNSSTLISIDQNSAAVTTIGSLGFPLGNISGLALDSTTSSLFGLDINLMTGQDELVSIDLQTGVAAAVGPLFTDGTFEIPGGLAFAPDSSEVPEPTSCGLMLLAATLAALQRARR